MDWIGAELRIIRNDEGAPIGVSITISQDKADKLEAEIKDMMSRDFVDRDSLRSFAGLGSWISTVVPVMRPFVQMLWAAATSQPSGREKTFKHGKWVSRARIRTALVWLKAFAALRLTTLPRQFLAAEPLHSPTVGFDASTTGGGAWFIGGGTSSLPERYITVEWTREDEKLLGALRGDPASLSGRPMPWCWP